MSVRYHLGAGALAIGLCLAAPASAGDKQDFEACDGRVHPGRQDDGMRGEPSQLSYLRNFATSVGKVAACDRALASKRLLPTQTLRRAHLLRARAAAYLQSGEPEKALADLDLAASATGDQTANRFFKRSMGASLDLLRAIAYAELGDSTRATELARSAMAERPYSSQVQQLGATITHAVGNGGKGGGADWRATMRLSPAAAASVLAREGAVGNFAAVLALRPNVSLTWPTKAPSPLALVTRDGEGLVGALLVSLYTAYAHAASGAPAQAKAEVAELRSHLQALRPPPGEKSKNTLPNVADVLEAVAAPRIKQIETRIAVAEGRHSDAIAALVGAALPKDASSVELLAALRAAAPAKEAALVPAPESLGFDPVKEHKESLKRLVPTALFAPETPRAVVDYERSRPNILGALLGGALSMGTTLLGGIERLDGFRSTPNADGTTKVEFVGNTPSALLVQEMTLLRAAELTQSAGKKAFEIVDRNDYARVMKTMRHGVELSSVPTGFKTELSIRYLDAADQSPRAIDALSVIDALGPLYYEEKRTKA